MIKPSSFKSTQLYLWNFKDQLHFTCLQHLLLVQSSYILVFASSHMSNVSHSPSQFTSLFFWFVFLQFICIWRSAFPWFHSQSSIASHPSLTHWPSNFHLCLKPTCRPSPSRLLSTLKEKFTSLIPTYDDFRHSAHHSLFVCLFHHSPLSPGSTYSNLYYSPWFSIFCLEE